MSKKGIALCLVAFVACIAITVWAQEKSLNRVVSERVVAQIDVSWIPGMYKVRPDSRRVGYVVKVSDKMVVSVNGKRGRNTMK